MKKGRFVLILVPIFLCACGGMQEEKPIYNKQIVQESESSKDEDTFVLDARIGDALFREDFRGVGELADTPENDAVLVNNVMSAIVCNDGQGTLYYINYGQYKDNYIYSYRDGVRELVIEKICDFICYDKGFLYFTESGSAPIPWSNEYGGILYRYEIATGETEEVLNERIYNLYVKADKIYFQKCGEREWFSMTEEDREPVSMGQLLPFFYGEYQLAFSDEEEAEKQLLLVNDQSEIPITTAYNFRGRTMTLVGDTVWISSRMENGIPAIASINLANGEHRFYPASSGTPSGATMGTDIGLDFMVFRGNLYVVTHSNVFRYDEEQGCFDVFLWDQTCYSGLYTDGEWLYGLSFGDYSADYHSNGLVRFKGDGSEREVIAE